MVAVETKVREIYKFFQEKKEEFFVDFQINGREIYKYRFRHKNNMPKCTIIFGITLEDFEDFTIDQIKDRIEKTRILNIIDTAEKNARYLLTTYGLKQF